LKAGASATINSGTNASGDGVSTLKWIKQHMWNNNGDVAELYDSNNNLVSTQ